MRTRRTLLGPVLALGALVALLALGAAACSSDPGPDRIERGADDADLTVLFLHGASYSPKIWEERGILDAVAAEGHRAVAVRIPDGADEGWLREQIDALGGPEQVVVVSPSASGEVSLAYLAILSDQELAGFVGVAPVGVPEFRRPDRSPEIPALLVWGADDDLIPRSRMDDLAAELPGAEKVVIPDGSHAPYDDEPEAFLDALLPWLDARAS